MVRDHLQTFPEQTLEYSNVGLIVVTIAQGRGVIPAEKCPSFKSLFLLISSLLVSS